MNKLAFLIFSIFLSVYGFAQCDGRYQDEIFESTTVTTVEYSDVYNWSVFDSGLDMDVYTPDEDNFDNRPLIIFAHGGSFYAGNKNNPEMIALCESFAKKGFVTASIQYRLTSLINLADSNVMIQTVFNAISDVKSAIRYFRKDAMLNNNSFGIDTSQIFVGGYSAGAIIAVNSSMLNNQSEIPSYLQEFVDNSGGLEGDSGNDGYSSRVNGVISLAGAVYLKSFIDSSDVPIVSIHAKDDETVMYDCDHALGYSVLPILCGSGEVHQTAESVGITNSLYSFDTGGHLIPVTQLSQVSIPFITDFIYPLLDCNSVNLEYYERFDCSVYPNPSSGLVNIKSLEPITQINIFDQMGRNIIAKQAMETNHLSFSDFSPGIYYLHLYSSKGMVSKKFTVLK
ncbi:MAG: T9SS type A sorting domain-containing protein [Flavobacteriales bacterium]